MQCTYLPGACVSLPAPVSAGWVAGFSHRHIAVTGSRQLLDSTAAANSRISGRRRDNDIERRPGLGPPPLGRFLNCSTTQFIPVQLVVLWMMGGLNTS
jgi:hypothetical protein